MNKINKIAFVFGLASLFMACDVVEEPVVSYDTCDTTNIQLSAKIIVESTPTDKRKVLLEDYTGHTCGNCPAAAAKVHELVDKYGKDIVPVGVHAGYFAEVKTTGDKYLTNFSTPAGEEYYTFFTVNSNPNGMVNRAPYNAKTVMNYDLWESAVQAQLSLPKTASINMKSTYYSDRKIDFLDINIVFDEANTKKHHLIVMITENNIIDWQKNYETGGDPNYDSPDESDFPHAHVLRKVYLDKTWGEPVNTSAVSANDEVNFNYQLCLEDQWDENELEIVAVLYETDTKQVIQTEAIHLVK